MLGTSVRFGEKMASCTIKIWITFLSSWIKMESWHLNGPPATVPFFFQLTLQVHVPGRNVSSALLYFCGRDLSFLICLKRLLCRILPRLVIVITINSIIFDWLKEKKSIVKQGLLCAFFSAVFGKWQCIIATIVYPVFS